MTIYDPVSRRTPELPSTPHQRIGIRLLMADLDIDTWRMTPEYRRFLAAADVTQPERNVRIDAVLCRLTKAQATALLAALQSEVPDVY